MPTLRLIASKVILVGLAVHGSASVGESNVSAPHPDYYDPIAEAAAYSGPAFINPNETSTNATLDSDATPPREICFNTIKEIACGSADSVVRFGRN